MLNGRAAQSHIGEDLSQLPNGARLEKTCASQAPRRRRSAPRSDGASGSKRPPPEQAFPASATIASTSRFYTRHPYGTTVSRDNRDAQPKRFHKLCL